jgi:hypothetical protein
VKKCATLGLRNYLLFPQPVRQLIPDFGYYEGPERVADTFIGLESIDIMEDIVLFCDKKSEVLILVSTK